MKPEYLFFNKKGQVTISMLLIFVLIFTIFSIFLITTTETSRSYRFRESMDAAILSGGASLSKGIDLYCYLSTFRIALFSIYWVVWLTVFLAPDKIPIIYDFTELIRKISKYIGKVQPLIPGIYTAKGIWDAYDIFNSNMIQISGEKSLFLLPNFFIEDLLNLDLNKILKEIKDPEILKKGYTAIGRREYNLLTQIRNKYSNIESKFLEKNDILINACLVKKRNSSIVDLSMAKKIDEFCKNWEQPSKIISDLEELKNLGENVNNLIDDFIDEIDDLEESLSNILGETNSFQVYYDYYFNIIVKNRLENKIKEINNKIIKIPTDYSNLLILEYLLNILIPNIDLKLYKISALIENELEPLIDTKNIKETDAIKVISEKISELYKLINSIISDIDSFKTNFYLLTYGVRNELQIDDYLNNLFIYRNDININFSEIKKIKNLIDEIEGKAKDFENGLKNFLKAALGVFKDFYELVKEIPGFKLIDDLLNWRLTELKEDWNEFKNLIDDIKNGTFSFIAYYSPELSVPEELFDKITSINLTIENLSQTIVDNIESFINQTIYSIIDEAMKIIDDLIDIQKKFVEDILKKLIFSAASGLIKAIISLGISALLDLIQTVILSLIENLIINIVKKVFDETLKENILKPVKEKIKELLNKITFLKEIFDNINEIQFIILRSIGYYRYSPNYISYYKNYLYDLITKEASII